jgi:hypothetical protein
LRYKAHSLKTEYNMHWIQPELWQAVIRGSAERDFQQSAFKKIASEGHGGSHL